MIIIEIRNHREVARKESWLARTLGHLAPGFVRRQVEQRVVDELHAQLVERGLEVEIRIEHTEETRDDEG